ncbi:MAG TPA: cystathionine beta-lyase [Caulobacteraceae bacterium]|nr:cystathionine beta-lyase [Caulobacteraceae bacterium]
MKSRGRGKGGGLPLPRTVGPPIQRGTTVLMDSAKALYESKGKPTYGLGGLATHAALAEALAELEHARAVRLYSSGLAALTGAMSAVLEAGDEVLITDAVYRPTRRFADHVLKRQGVSARYYAPRASAEEILAEAGRSCRLIVLESPGSLTFELQDVAAIAAAARARGILTLMDNTWAAGLLFRPLDHGVDISVQALTKYIGGHSDVFLGSAATREPKLDRLLAETIRDFGWGVAAEDAYLGLRGLRTLETRLARHGESALTVARWLAGRPEVREVLFPPLPGAADHDLWRRDFTGAAGLMGVVLRPRPQAAVFAFLDALEVFGLGFSWGGFESLAIWADPQFDCRLHPPGFAGPVIRLAIGLEPVDTLLADLDRGFGALNEGSR